MNQSAALEVPEGLDDDIGIVQFVSGTRNGESNWAYVLMKPSRYLDYYVEVNNGNSVDLLEYGDILEHGAGDEAPVEIQEAMARDYGHTPEIDAMIYALGEEMLEEIKEPSHD